MQQERIVEEATSARLQSLTAQVAELSRDLVAARELCSQLEKKREASERETAKFAGEAETAHCQISALRQELDSLRFEVRALASEHSPSLSASFFLVIRSIRRLLPSSWSSVTLMQHFGG
nr:unnamed protein product [Spirometra erinaceieuropaei]